MRMFATLLSFTNTRAVLCFQLVEKIENFLGIKGPLKNSRKAKIKTSPAEKLSLPSVWCYNSQNWKVQNDVMDEIFNIQMKSRVESRENREKERERERERRDGTL